MIRDTTYNKMRQLKRENKTLRERSEKYRDASVHARKALVRLHTLFSEYGKMQILTQNYEINPLVSAIISSGLKEDGKEGLYWEDD